MIGGGGGGVGGSNGNNAGIGVGVGDGESREYASRRVGPPLIVLGRQEMPKSKKEMSMCRMPDK